MLAVNPYVEKAKTSKPLEGFVGFVPNQNSNCFAASCLSVSVVLHPAFLLLIRVYPWFELNCYRYGTNCLKLTKRSARSRTRRLTEAAEKDLRA